MAEELREAERQISILDEGRKNNMIAIRDLEMTKERLLSFAEYAKDAQPEVLVTLIQTIVERIYIVDKDDERYCHIFIKGCSGEDYTGFFQTAGYIEQKNTPVCDSEQCCICPEISSTNHLRKDKAGHRTDDSKVVRIQGGRDNRSRSVQRPYPHARVNTTQYSVSQFMGYLKGKSSLMIFEKYANLKYKYGNRHFWCRGYYVSTVGKNRKAIEQYIRNQLQEDYTED